MEAGPRNRPHREPHLPPEGQSAGPDGTAPADEPVARLDALHRHDTLETDLLGAEPPAEQSFRELRPPRRLRVWQLDPDRRDSARWRLADVRLPARLRVRRRRTGGRHARPAAELLRRRLGVMAARRVGYTWPGLPARGSGRPPRLALHRRLHRPVAVLAASSPCGGWPGCADAPAAAAPATYDRERERRTARPALPQGPRHRERLRDRPRPGRPPRRCPPAAVARLCDRRAGHRRRRTAAGRPVGRAPGGRGDGRRGRVVHGLPQQRRQHRRDVRQRRAGLRPLPRSAPDSPDAGDLAVATRAGVRRVHLAKDAADGTPGDITVDMGRAALPDGDGHRHRRRPQPGRPATSTWATRTRSPSSTTSRTPATCCSTPRSSPRTTPTRTGVNVEFVVDRGPRHVALRVHERGSGETRSCGTGACAVMVAAARRDGARPGGRPARPVTYTVDLPGGRLVDHRAPGRRRSR